VQNAGLVAGVLRFRPEWPEVLSVGLPVLAIRRCALNHDRRRATLRGWHPIPIRGCASSARY
jgi:hypothetical protein